MVMIRLPSRKVKPSTLHPLPPDTTQIMTLSSEYGTYKTVKAMAFRQKSLKPFQLVPVRSAAAFHTVHPHCNVVPASGSELTASVSYLHTQVLLPQRRVYRGIHAYGRVRGCGRGGGGPLGP